MTRYNQGRARSPAGHVGATRSSDAATCNQGKVRLGDAAPVFAPRRPVRGDKVERDAATCNQGKVRLGDAAPVFAPRRPVRATRSSVTRLPATRARCGWETPPRCSRRAGPLGATRSA